MLLLLASAGCSIPISAAPDTSLKSFRPITLSCQDTAETRKQIVAHNAVYDTLKKGKRIVYSDDCLSEAKTS